MSFAQTWPYLLALVAAAALDIVCNLLLKKSQGFSHKILGGVALLFMCAALTGMYYAVRGLPLAVAWALWTSLGVLGTCLGGWFFFHQKIRGKAWLGMLLLLGGIALLYAD